MTFLNSDNSFLQGTLAKVTFTPAKDFNLPRASGQLAQHQCRYTVYDLKINDNPLGDPIVVDESAPQVSHWMNIFPEPDPFKPGNYFFDLLIPDYQNDKMFELEIRAKDDVREQYTDSLTDVIYTFYNNSPRITIVSLEWDSTFTKQVVNYSVLDPGFIRPLNLEEIEKNVSLKNNFKNKYLLEIEDALRLPSSLSLKLLSYESSSDVKETDLTNLEWNSDIYLTKNRKITLSTPHTNPDINLHFQIKSSILNASFLSKIESITGNVILPAQKTSFTIGNANIRANMPKNAPSNGNTAAGMFSHSEYNKIDGDAERGNSIGLYDHYIKPGENIVRDEPSIGFMSAAHKELAKIQYIEDENGGNLFAFIWDKSNPVATPKHFSLGGGGVSSSLELNQDLNNITEIGNYNTPSSTIADSILNKPEDFSGPFHLQISQAENLIQRIVFEGAPSSFFSRVQNKDGTWTEWTPIQFINAVRHEYLQTTNATTPPSSDSSLWSSEKPEEVAGQYIWQRIKLEFTLGQRIYSDPTMISPDSVQIPNRYYRYSLDDDPNTVMQESPVGMKYIGIANTFDKIAPTDKSAYEWTRFTGYDGSDGTDWTIGSDGMWYKDGVKTSNKAIGVDGSPGVGIEEHLEYYLATSQGTGVTTDHAVWDWTETPQQIDEYNKFLWNYSTTEYTNGVVSTESPVIIGSYGADGRGIEGVKEYYLVSSLKTGITTDHAVWNWTETPQQMDENNKFLWNYEEILYTDDTSSKTEPAIVGVRGDDGADGTPGTGVRSVIVEYAIGDDTTEPELTSWTTTPPDTWEDDQYLWTRYKITYTDDEIKYTGANRLSDVEAQRALAKAQELINEAREIIEARLDETDHTILAIANDQTISPLEEADLQNLIAQVDIDTSILIAKNDGVHDASFLTTAGDNLKNFISGVLSAGSYAEINSAEFNDLYQTYKNEVATLESLIRNTDEQRYTDIEAGQTILGTRIGSYEEQLKLSSDLIGMYLDRGYGLEQAMTLARDELVFYIDNQRKAWIGLNGLNADNATIGQSARIGNHEFQKFGTDYTTINWVGE